MNRVLFEVSYIGNIYGLAHIVLGFGIFLFLYFDLKRIKNDGQERDREIARVAENRGLFFFWERTGRNFYFGWSVF